MDTTTAASLFNPRNKLLDEEGVRALLQEYGVTMKPKNLALYQQAFTHKSYCLRKNDGAVEGNRLCPEGCVPLQAASYERLEFLGDAVLNQVVAEYLYRRYHYENEGFLTKIRTKIVNGVALGELGARMGLGRHLLIAASTEAVSGRTNPKLLEDCFEALVGAIYMDYNAYRIKSKHLEDCGVGFQTAATFIVTVIERYVDFAELARNPGNHKEHLIRYMQGHVGTMPRFDECPGDAGGCTVLVYRGSEAIASGTGENRKQAEQSAARNALDTQEDMDPWAVVQLFFKDNPSYVTKHHIDGYNDFVRNKLPALLRGIPITVVKADAAGRQRFRIDVRLGGKDGDQIYLSKPTYLTEEGKAAPLYPNDARVRNLDYWSDVHADISVEYTDLEGGGSPGQTESVLFEKVRVGSVPILVNSCLCVLDGMPAVLRREMGSCPYDQGGYFIVDGKEKVIVAQERVVTNRLYMATQVDTDKYAMEAQIQCTSEGDPFKKTVVLLITAKQRHHTVLVRVPDVEEDMPLAVVFRALGVESDRRILEHTGALSPEDSGPETKASALSDFLYWTLMDSPPGVYTQQQALEHMAAHVRYGSTEHVMHILANDFLRQTGPSLRLKALTLGRLVQHMVRTHLGMTPPVNRDSFAHKRLDASGELLFGLFRDGLNQFRRGARKAIDYMFLAGGWAEAQSLRDFIQPKDVPNIFDAGVVDAMMKGSMKGNWGLENDPSKGGIVQELNRVSFLGYQSHVRRLCAPIGSDSKLAGPRRLHPTQWGVLCPILSPDGASIGLDKHLSIMAHVTLDAPPEPMRRCLRDLGVRSVEDPADPPSMAEMAAQALVFLNNTMVGTHAEPDGLVRRLREHRRRGVISAFTGVVWDRLAGEVQVFSHGGRLCRPLMVVRDGGAPLLERTGGADHSSKPWHHLFSGWGRELQDTRYLPERAGADPAPMEFIDVEEAADCLIAMGPRDLQQRAALQFTHCEIHPSTTLSLYTNTVPFANHNPAPRNVFSGAQGKQAVGVYATNFNNRLDGMSYVLNYPQRPLVTTRYNALTGNDQLPYGANLIVAILSYTGYNMEDAVLMNQAAVDRGLFSTTYLKSFMETEADDRLRGRATVFCNPYALSASVPGLRCNYANELTLNEHGMPKLNAFVEDGDALVGRVRMVTRVDAATKERRVEASDASKVADKTVEGVVDKVLAFRDENNVRSVKVRLRRLRVPTMGDKVASRHSQKGVVGMLLPHEDMPHTADGLVPDIIINPHAMPTRMTVAHLLETLCGKAGAAAGYISDGTVFEERDWDFHARQLREAGLEGAGNEVMYSGRTGEQMQADVFIGSTYYMRLKHMVADKFNYRATGPVSSVTKQPVRGRAIDGGLRLGEMERDAMLANGLGGFIKEAFMDKADGNLMRMDDDVGLAHSVAVPHSWKLLIHELGALGVGVRFRFGEQPTNDSDSETDEAADEENVAVP
ncbi:hypothetical protein HXX76_014153 [Chlamydomonas incerta]|uniref:DNA-directed RNA polymerase subunit beta n=1 Tax=Chlamydomonas incerta TaxID=51695 RepID=A0A835SQL1_CHLIN|nr:hypothetical protein HXX76_014153 [Chlamydomonas incerta]|eukprot:KAG2424995.1 hypothetical protein HXX76_014153 [Chlamydomonas incerta]